MGNEEHLFKKEEPPKNPENLSEGRRIQTVHRFVGQIYDRVCLTGDWMRDDEGGSGAMRFIEGAPINDRIGLAFIIGGLMRDISESVRPSPSSAPVKLTALNEANRAEFVKTLNSIRVILSDAVNTDATQVALVNALNNNLHYFADLPKAIDHSNYSIEGEVAKTKEGLRTLNNDLSSILSGTGSAWPPNFPS